METLIINSETDNLQFRNIVNITPEEKIEFNKIMKGNPEMEETKALKQARENLK